MPMSEELLVTLEEPNWYVELEKLGAADELAVGVWTTEELGMKELLGLVDGLCRPVSEGVIATLEESVTDAVFDGTRFVRVGPH